MNERFRKAEPKDIRKIEALFIEMLKTIYQTNDVQGYAPGDLDRFFSDREDWICVAEYEEELNGFLSIEVHREEDYIYLDDLAVTEKCRNRGLGTRLIHIAEDFAKESGIPAIVLHVEKANTDARRLYYRLGYWEDVIQGSRIRMIKELRKNMIS